MLSRSSSSRGGAKPKGVSTEELKMNQVEEIRLTLAKKRKQNEEFMKKALLAQGKGEYKITERQKSCLFLPFTN